MAKAKSQKLVRRAAFIEALAGFLVNNQAMKSIELEMNKPSAIEWAKVRGATPLFGYPTLEEAVEVLNGFLWGGEA